MEISFEEFNKKRPRSLDHMINGTLSYESNIFMHLQLREKTRSKQCIPQGPINSIFANPC